MVAQNKAKRLHLALQVKQANVILIKSRGRQAPATEIMISLIWTTTIEIARTEIVQPDSNIWQLRRGEAEWEDM